MFDVGFSEMLVIAVVALIVLGPERLPKAARLAGLWVRKARAQWYAVKAELESELANEQLRRDLKAPLDELKAPLDEVRQSFEGAAATADGLMRPQASPAAPPAPAAAPAGHDETKP